jgi:hypothetical protein
MDAYANRFLVFLRYVPHLKDEKARIHKFLSVYPSPIRIGLRLMSL